MMASARRPVPGPCGMAPAGEARSGTLDGPIGRTRRCETPERTDAGERAGRPEARSTEGQSMPPVVVNAAMLSCTMGLGPPMTLTTIPKGPPVTAGGQQLATIADAIPMANIPTFGMCNSPTNAAVIAATAAFVGELH